MDADVLGAKALGISALDYSPPPQPSILASPYHHPFFPSFFVHLLLLHLTLPFSIYLTPHIPPISHANPSKSTAHPFTSTWSIPIYPNPPHHITYKMLTICIQLLLKCQTLYFPAGTIITDNREKAKGMFIITEGQVPAW